MSRRDHYRVTPAMTRGLRFSGLIRRTFDFLLRHTRECGEPILTRILAGTDLVASYDTMGCGVPILTRVITGPYSVASYDTQGDVENLF